jgi:enoyl-CoA hydratase
MSNDEPWVLREVDGDGVCTLVLNRPDRLNPLGDAMIEALFAEVAAAMGDDAVRVVVLRGAGRSFSSGADVGAPGGVRPGALDDRDHMLDERSGRFLELWDAPKPVIAQVHGHCLGTALALCNCVDLVVVAEDAAIGWPLPLGGGLIGPSWVHFVGVRRAKELSFQAITRITGREAADVGWANRAVPLAELDDAVATMARRIARTPRGVLRLKKEAINAAADRMGFRESVRTGPTYNALAHTDPEVDGVRALVGDVGFKAATERYLD